MENIVSAPKTDVFRVRINPEIKQELESVYAKNGLTLTDAINVFFQQSLNAGGFPFAVTEDNAEIIKANVMQHFSSFPLIDRCAVFQYNHHPYCALRTHKGVLGTANSIATGR